LKIGIDEQAILQSLEGLHEQAIQQVTVRETKLRLYLKKLKELKCINTSTVAISLPNVREIIECFWSIAAMHLGYLST